MRPVLSAAEPMALETKRLAYALTDAVAAAADPRPSLEDVIEWVGRRADEQYSAVQSATVLAGSVPDGMPRELVLGRKAIDLLAKIIERKDEVMFLLRAKPRHERGQRSR